MASAQAAVRTDLHDKDVSKLSSQYKLAVASTGTPIQAAQRHAEMIDLDPESSLQPLSAVRDANGTTNYRYQQTFRGIPVFGEQVVVSEDAKGQLVHLFGRKVERLGAELPMNPSLLARERAQSTGERAWLAKRPGVSEVKERNARLMVYVDSKDHAHLSYVVSFYADKVGGGAATHPYLVIDARTGKVLNAWEGLTTDQIGTGPGGNARTGQYEWGSSSTYGYLDVTKVGTTCTMENADVKTVNLNSATTGTTAWSYTCPRNTTKAINGAYAPLNDAHFLGGVVQNMYQAYTGAKALSIKLVMRAHYGTAYENASWDPTGMTMSFGDGDTIFYPLVSADIAAHEVSHGYTQQHSNLTYQGQSGGINEAFSDIAGEAAEYYWKGSNDFLVGAEIVKSGTALRYMADPTLDGHSIAHVSDFVTGNWTCEPIGVFFCQDGYEKVYHEGTNVHYSSGIYNKAFYNLAHTPGWTTADAFKVFARANAVYWTPSTDFNQGVCGVETAATDLNLPLWDVTAAFTDVGATCATSPALLTVNDVSISEGNSGTKTATFTVSLSKTRTSAVSFTIATANGTASSGTDYVAKTATGQIAAGQTSATFSVVINGDTAVEGNETFSVNLSNASGALIRDSQGRGTITNDDLPLLTVSDVSLGEGSSGQTTATFIVSLSQPVPTAVTFNVATSNGTATAGSDYVAVNRTGQLLDAGRSQTTVTVNVIGDTVVEGNETFFVNLSAVSGAIVQDGVGQGTILNDD